MQRVARLLREAPLTQGLPPAEAACPASVTLVALISALHVSSCSGCLDPAVDERQLEIEGGPGFTWQYSSLWTVSMGLADPLLLMLRVVLPWLIYSYQSAP